MELVPFRPLHLAHLTPAVAPPEMLARFMQGYWPAGPAWTGLIDGSPVGCGGVVRRGEVGRGWLILSYPVRTVAVHRAVCRVIARELADGTVRRIEARALEDWDSARRWLERLGFQAVGRDGEFRIYAR